MPEAVKWGIVCTTNAPIADVLGFAAHHLDLGAHRIYIYLDEPAPEAETHLAAHPKLRVIQTDATYWKRANGKRPPNHQPRQTANATQAYHKAGDVDWLAHIDVDEFLLPDAPMATQLAALPHGCQTARIKPIESLAPDSPDDGVTWFKACKPSPRARAADANTLYPVYGPYLNGGFLSHVMGKIFVRTGIDGLKFRIHHAFVGDETNPHQIELPETKLAHMHAKSWDDWFALYQYRHAKGSYRDELKPVRPAESGGLNLHQFFAEIEAADGVAGLRAFYDTVCLATPGHRAQLDALGLLRSHRFELATKTQRHFPAYASENTLSD
jgi:hypothetical protein